MVMSCGAGVVRGHCDGSQTDGRSKVHCGHGKRQFGQVRYKSNGGRTKLRQLCCSWRRYHCCRGFGRCRCSWPVVILTLLQLLLVVVLLWMVLMLIAMRKRWKFVMWRNREGMGGIDGVARRKDGIWCEIGKSRH